ncbi:MAG TPA: DUF3107 domain-containing protein [Acidimicrobiia bacterium]|jgi:hypothetical protein
MADTVKVRIGVHSARELELDVEDADATVAAVEKAVSNGDGLVWIKDAKGHRHGIVAAQIAFVEVESKDEKSVGFGVGG